MGRYRGRVQRSLTPLLALIGWTLFVWGGRIRNILNDDTLMGWSMTWRLALAAAFVAAAVAALIATLLDSRAISATAIVLAVFGIVVWSIRGVDIALGDHSAAFIAVHTALASITIALGLVVLSRVSRGRPAAVSSTVDG